jgi:methionyl-tRNA synthetase
MAHLAESLRIVSVLLQPFLTNAPRRIWEQLGIREGEATAWDSARQFGRIPSGTRVTKGEPIFPRLDAAQEIEFIAQSMAGGKTAAANGAAGQSQEPQQTKPQQDPERSAAQEIGIDDFAKVELRVAQILSAAPVKNADKLLKLELDLGYERRQVVSGIARHYTPEQLTGRKVIVVANLKPVKLRGEWSQGMILAASQGEQVMLATVPDEMPNGSIVK